ncbi:glutamine--fructose-6-phosphate transaminase (isomerizing) [Porticoccus sp. W117]|uniref:glutamine--fructose-6-phosphate transaminase (isomerizing) n=1 Tax=Porticoccus sp. W117 TaxID=3054777 RepID=UPI002593E013|nr:glutamine--fructose-6-phosphate transaminase (isomerizing) [Porticoccus sp. W117]MDM3870796.1 glutamine--fructose-6-phosphate transaminase (isomerizing) [Porticoccus sp. W117]
MCGIVGAVAHRNVTNILVEGLKRLEYRGYDSAGVAVLDIDGKIQIRKKAGKVANMEEQLAADPARGQLGIAHTRWATHGVPNDINAHPHRSSYIAVVHNGIIENHDQLRAELKASGYQFVSDTDTEVVAHLMHACQEQGQDLFASLQTVAERLEGAFALAAISEREPGRLVGTRRNVPLVLGVGIEENFIASDQMALRTVTDRFVFLNEGDLVDLKTDSYKIVDTEGNTVRREVVQLSGDDGSADKGGYRHYMLKEIFEQPKVLGDTLQGRISDKHVLPQAFGQQATEIFEKVENVHIVACGTSYHSGMVAKYWLEEWAGIPCQVEVASEYRYRKVVVPSNTLFVTISQSGETADTLAALRAAKEAGYLGALTICNVASSSLVRESDLSLMTLAGPEIGVASTKAFTTQLVALQLFSIGIGRYHGLSEEREQELVAALYQLPQLCEQVLQLDKQIEQTFECFNEKHHALFLGRGVQFPVALEGALKLKEISYIHAEAYPSGELKHGPLALVDDDMPVVAVAPNNELLEKLKSNLHEVQARGGKLFVFADKDSGFISQEGVTVIDLPHVPESLEAIIYTLPLQLLSYHVALVKGTDVDQPRNLAKSVTVE